MAARKNPVDTVDLDKLSPTRDDAGFLVRRTRGVESVPSPVRAAGIRVTDGGAAAGSSSTTSVGASRAAVDARYYPHTLR